MERLELCHLLYIRSRRPKRIILIRHAESEGNLNKEVYTSTPDHALKITERGRKQVTLGQSVGFVSGGIREIDALLSLQLAPLY